MHAPMSPCILPDVTRCLLMPMISTYHLYCSCLLLLLFLPIANTYCTCPIHGIEPSCISYNADQGQHRGRQKVAGSGAVEGWVLSGGQVEGLVSVGSMYAARARDFFTCTEAVHCLPALPSLQDVRKAVLSALPGCERMVEELIARTRDVNYEVTTAH